MARKVCSSASVKSSVNQPLMLTLSISLVVLRAANSGLSANVGRARNFVFVARHQHAVAGADKIGLYDIGAILDGLGIAFKCMFRAQCTGTAMADHQFVRQG